jgi:hypothetical protein
VQLSRAATSEQFNALARAIDQQMSDLARRQQDWRSARDKEAAELRDIGLAGLVGLMLGLITGSVVVEAHGAPSAPYEFVGTFTGTISYGGGSESEKLSDEH